MPHRSETLHQRHDSLKHREPADEIEKGHFEIASAMSPPLDRRGEFRFRAYQSRRSQNPGFTPKQAAVSRGYWITSRNRRPRRLRPRHRRCSSASYRARTAS
jgi:hypothetical protein